MLLRRPSGAPVPSVPVSLLDAAGAPVPSSAGGVVTTITGPDGTFAFSGVVAGTYVVAVTPPSGFEAGARTIDATAGDVGAIDFQLVPVVAPAPPASGVIAVTPRFTG